MWQSGCHRYQSEDGLARVEVLMENDTVWLSKNQMAELFQRDRTNIGRHIQSIFREGEEDEKSNVQKMHVPFSDKRSNENRSFV